jgi:Tol biopolymer transport system component
MNHRSLFGTVIVAILVITIIGGCAPASLFPKIIALELVDGDFEIAVLDLNQGMTQYLTNTIAMASISYSYCEEKQQIAYSAYVDGGQEIIYQDLVTANTRLVTEGDNHFRLPDWSPDCSMLAFTSDDSNPSVFVHNLESSVTDPVPVDEGFFLHGASWSPSSQFLATYVPVPFYDEEAFNLGIIDIANHKLTRLSGLADYPFSEAVWSAEGDKIYFSAIQERSAFQLYEFDVNTGLQKPIVKTESNDHYPRLSPDGTYLSFLRSSLVANAYTLGVLDLSSKRTELLTSEPMAISAILWLDNQRLVLSEYKSAQNETTYYVVDRVTKNLKRIFRFDGQFIHPEIISS